MSLLVHMTPDRIPIRLSKKEQEAPNEVLAELFEEYTIGAIRAKLTELVHTALAEDDRYNNPKNRSDLLAFYIKLERALEAAYILNYLKTKGSMSDA